MTGTTNNPGVSHENGAIETAHASLKHRLDQAFKLRGSTDFASIADYQAFIDRSITRLNQLTLTRFRVRCIDYRHVIHSLAAKPQAFRFCKFRDELFPDDNYRQLWQRIDQQLSSRSLSDLRLIYCANGTSGSYYPDFSLHRMTMRLKIRPICPRFLTLLATIT